jgi:hypothetical protein
MSCPNCLPYRPLSLPVTQSWSHGSFNLRRLVQDVGIWCGEVRKTTSGRTERGAFQKAGVDPLASPRTLHDSCNLQASLGKPLAVLGRDGFTGRSCGSSLPSYSFAAPRRRVMRRSATDKRQAATLSSVREHPKYRPLRKQISISTIRVGDLGNLGTRDLFKSTNRAFGSDRQCSVHTEVDQALGRFDHIIL